MSLTFYTVLTLLDDDAMLLDEIRSEIKQQFFKKIIVVTETGTGGNNKHYNIVYQLDPCYDEINKVKTVANFQKNAKRYWMNLYEKEFLETLTTTKYLIKTSICTSPENVIGGYLQKEDDKQILLNHGYDIIQMVDLASQNMKLQNKPKSKNLYDFIDNKVLPYINSQQTGYVCAKELCNTAFFHLSRVNDPEALYYFRTHRTKLILNVLRAKLNQKDMVEIIGAFD